MATLYEYYITGGISNATAYGDIRLAQTFTPATSHIITSVKLLLYRNGTPGELTVAIRATSGGHPSSDDLCSGTTEGNSLDDDDTNPEWREITLGDGYSLDASTKYAIELRALAGSIGNAPYWKYHANEGAYAGGNVERTADAGVNWTSFADHDFMFEEWGDVGESPTVTTQAVTAISGTTATGNGNVTGLGTPTATQHGHCWNTTGTPTTTSDSKTENGVPAATGAFTSSLTGLTSATKYYVRAYATNTEGTGYGEQVIFIAGAVGPGEGSGIYAVVEERFHYVDAYGNERYLEGTLV